MVEIWKSGLARSVGVSNWNTSHIQDLMDSGLPLPAVLAVQWNLAHKFNDSSNVVPGAPVERGAETAGELRQFCLKHNIIFNGYSPYSGPGGVAKTLGNPILQHIAEAHNVSTAQVVLNWHYQLSIPFNPESQNPTHQSEILEAFKFKLTQDEMNTLNMLKLHDVDAVL